jgi:hypothetical protein
MHLRTSKADLIVAAQVYINGHLATVVHGTNLSTVVAALRKPPRGSKPLRRYRVQVLASIATGGTLGLTRYFAACRPGAKGSSKG